MSLRIPDANSMPPDGSGDGAPAPMVNPFAAGPGGFLSASDLESKSSRFSGVFVLVLVVAMAGAVLFGMRQMGMGPKLSLAEIEIDYPLEGGALQANSDHERILADLKSGGNVHRIPLEMVQTNPFLWRSLLPKETPAAKEATAEDLTRKQAEDRNRKIAVAASGLVLNSLMGGRVPMARIDGQLVRVGDRVGDFFTVTSITGRTVELECEGESFSIVMGEDEAGAPNPFGGSKPRR